MTKEISDLLQELHRAGQTGLIILIASLITIIVLGFCFIWLQRQTINRFKELEGPTESLRKERNSVQENEINSFKNQFDIVIKTNEELRKEIDRVSQKQDSLRDKQNQIEKSVKEAISIGLSDIKERITKVSVDEILHELPASFRNDLEAQISDSAERMINDYVSKIKEAPYQFIDYRGIMLPIENMITDKLKRFRDTLKDDFTVPLDRDRGFYDRYIYRDEFIDRLAARIASHLPGRYP